MAEYNPSKIVKDGNTYNFRDTTKIPLAGSNQISGSLIPSTDGTVNLGSPSYQWNQAYIKSYYYNGVQWGLDKANVWTAHQKFVGSNSRGVVSIYNPAYTKGSALSSTDLPLGSIFMGDDGQTGLVNALGFISADLASNGDRTTLSLSAIENTASSAARANVVIVYDKSDSKNPRKVTIQGTVLPHANATYSLGTSTIKWKSLNGINPGALSLQGSGAIDISSNITVLDGTASNKFTPQINGWLHINGTGTSNDAYIYVVQGRVGMKGTNNTSSYRCAVLIPVVAGAEVSITCKLTTLTWANITPCQGNV